MKDFDNSLLVQMAAEQALFFWLVNMEISDSLNQYYTTLDIDVFCDSNLYQSAEFEVRPVNYSMDMAVDKLQLDFANVDLTMSATLLNNTVTNRPVIVLLGTLVDSVPVVEEVFRGVVSAWELDEKKAEIMVANELVYWAKKTLRVPGALCPWVFKGTECGYSGSAEECNKTYARCDVLNNTNYFGGFRFFPAIEEKEIWWGKSS